MEGPAPIFRLAADSAVLRQEAEQSHRAFSGRMARVLPTGSEVVHIGATAIPDCLTAGGMDIMIRVDPENFTQVEAMLDVMFDRIGSSDATDGYARYRDRDAKPPQTVRLVSRGTAWDNFASFTAVLNENPALLREYNALKRNCEGGPVDAYRAAKEAFILRILRNTNR